MAFFSDFTLRTSGDLALTDHLVGIKGDDSPDDNIKITVDELLAYFQAELDFGSGGSAHIIEDEGTPLTDRASLNFVGAGVTVTDAGGKTVVTIPASGAGSVDTANSPNAGEFARFTDEDTIEGRTASETRTDLSLVIGTNIQAWSANLDEYAAVNPTAAGLALLDDADNAAQLITLGLTATAAELNTLDGITASTAELNFTDGVTSAIQTQLDGKQPLDSGLTALAAFNTDGLIVQTANNTFAGRTLTGTADQVTVSNGGGIAGNPTVSLPTPLVITALGLNGKVNEYNNTAILNGEVLIGHTANGTFEKSTLTAGSGISITDGAGTITIEATGGGGGHSIEDEGSPLTARSKLNFVGAGVTVTDDSGDDATVVTIGGAGSATDVEIDVTGIIGGAVGRILFEAGDNTVTQNAGLTFGSGILAAGTFSGTVVTATRIIGDFLELNDSDDSNWIRIRTTEDLTGDRFLTLLIGDANRTLTLTGDASIEGTNTGDQDLSGKQDLDATLTALAAFNTNGVLVQTANNTFAGRTLTGTANQIAVTNGDGVAGAPTLAFTDPINLPEAQLLENKPILLDPVLSADGQYTGIAVAGTAGATLAFGDLIYLAVADSRWELTDANAEATAGGVELGMCVLAAASDGDPTRVLKYGKIRADAAFPTLTIGAPVYVSTTAGDVQVAQPTGTDDVIRIVGHAITADVLFFNPSRDWMTHT